MTTGKSQTKGLRAIARQANDRLASTNAPRLRTLNRSTRPACPNHHNGGRGGGPMHTGCPIRRGSGKTYFEYRCKDRDEKSLPKRGQQCQNRTSERPRRIGFDEMGCGCHAISNPLGRSGFAWHCATHAVARVARQGCPRLRAKNAHPMSSVDLRRASNAGELPATK